MSQPDVPARFANRESDAADMRAIQEFIDEALIIEVLNVIKSGKEATVYRCRAHPSLGAPFAAAKVYHTTGHRGFQRSASYEEGRFAGVAGQVKRAVANRSEFGQNAQLAFWVGREFDLLSQLNYAGADVPAPYACTETAILMEYLGTEDEPATQLQHAEFAEGEADELFDTILDNIELFIRENVVHGDLSAFNILYHEGRIAIIDFPQAVDARNNTSAKDLLQRDLTNIVQFFNRHRVGLEEDPKRMATRLWNLWKYGEV